MNYLTEIPCCSVNRENLSAGGETCRKQLFAGRLKTDDEHSLDGVKAPDPLQFFVLEGTREP
jgi:hypothetical protein